MFFSLQELTGVTQESFQSFSRGTISKMRRDGNNNKMSAAKRLLLVFVKIKLGLTITALSKIVKLGKSASHNCDLFFVFAACCVVRVPKNESLGLRSESIEEQSYLGKVPSLNVVLGMSFFTCRHSQTLFLKARSRKRSGIR